MKEPWWVAQIERLQFEMKDDASWLNCIEAIIAADAAATSPFRPQAGTRVDCRDRGRRGHVGIPPVPLRWTADSTEPKEAA